MQLNAQHFELSCVYICTCVFYVMLDMYVYTLDL